MNGECFLALKQHLNEEEHIPRDDIYNPQNALSRSSEIIKSNPMIDLTMS